MDAIKRLLFSIILLFIATSLYSSSYSFRKYQHVREFYSNIYQDTIDIGIKNNLPPAAVMAIAGLESGYGRGYVSKITGNILSLGAFKGDAELPSLYLPYSKSQKKVLFDPKEILRHSKTDLVYKQRPKSLKRDYRPSKYAGSTKKLEFLLYNHNSKKQAIKACLNDFVTRWISTSSNIKSFRDAKVYLNRQVEINGLKVLFEKKLNEKFIDMIGGHKNSFNYRKTWPKKVKLIMKKTGLIELVREIYINKKDFNTAWDLK